MAKNKIITSQGNVQFINSKGKTINMHPMHCYAVYENDTVSFLFIYMKEYSGQAFFASQYEDVEVNGESYDNMDDLKEAINYAFAKAGAQARTEIVEELPEDPFTNTIYLLPKEHGEGYDEYIWNEDEGWQLIGDTDIEFERYLQIADFNPYSADTKDYIDAVSGNTVQNATDIVALSGAIDTEISARTDADTALSGAVDTVSSALTEESQRAISAETALGGRIDTVNGRVDAEQIARAQADTAISGAVDTVSGITNTKADKVDAVASAEYVASAKTINFMNISGTVISSIDATDFVVDGMIEDVRIDTISGVSYLVIDFNTESGIEDIEIPLSDIFNPDNYYDKTAIDNIVSGLNDSIDTKFDASGITAYSTTVEVGNAIDAATSGKVDTSAFTAYSASVETALSGKADLSALTEDERVWGEALNDLNSRINTVSGDVLSSGDVQTQIDSSISGKQDVSGMTAYTEVTAFTAHTSDTDIHVTTAQTAAWDAKSDFSGSYNDLTDKPTIPTVPTSNTAFTNDAGYITEDALSGYAESSAVTEEITATISGKADTSAVTAVQDSLSGYVTTDTEQDITGNKTFIGSSSTSEKPIIFKQVNDSHKIGFACKNSASTNNELATFEFRPNTYTDSSSAPHPLLYIGHYRKTETANAGVPQTMVGFRQYDQSGAAAYHYLMPLPAEAKTPFSLTTSFKNYFAPLGFKNGSTMITTDNTGVADFSSVLGGLKLVKLTQQEYDLLPTKDNNTLYVIT